MNKTYCPFVDGACNSECVFWVRNTPIGDGTDTNCRLVAAAASLEYIADVSGAEDDRKTPKR